MQIRKDVLKIAVPVFTEQLFITSIGILNTIIASGLGKQAISAIGTVDSFNNIIIFFFNSLAVGGTAVVAQYMGQKNHAEVREAANQAIFSSIAISFLVTLIAGVFRYDIMLFLIGKAERQVVDYSIAYFGITLFNYPLTAFSFVASGILRSTGKQDKPMKINIIINIINVILSYLLIYGVSVHNVHMNVRIQGMGVKGAAVGITISRLIGVILFIYALTGQSHIISLKAIKTLKINLQMQKTILGIGFPAGIESFLFNIGKFVQQIFVISLGTASLAANTISWSVFTLLIIPGNAFSIVAVTMVGVFSGMREYDEAKKVNLYLVKLGMVCNFVISLFAFPLSSFIASAYSRDAEVVRITSELIRVNAVVIPILWPLSFIVPSGLRGAGDSTFTMIVSTASLWFFRVFIGYILSIVLRFGIIGLWAAMYCDWVVRALVFYLRWTRGKWMVRKIAATEEVATL